MALDDTFFRQIQLGQVAIFACHVNVTGHPPSGQIYVTYHSTPSSFCFASAKYTCLWCGYTVYTLPIPYIYIYSQPASKRPIFLHQICSTPSHNSNFATTALFGIQHSSQLCISILQNSRQQQFINCKSFLFGPCSTTGLVLRSSLSRIEHIVAKSRRLALSLFSFQLLRPSRVSEATALFHVVLGELISSSKTHEAQILLLSIIR